MSKKHFISTLALLLVVAVPTTLFVAPRPASAQLASLASAASCLGLIEGGKSAITGTIATVLSVPVIDHANLSENTVSAGATSQDCITTTILQPLARLLARIVLQQITASTINWINGGNSTGQPSYIGNLSVHLQGVGDSAAFAFLGQLGRASSPFSSSIASSLRVNYLQQTSVAGFFAANQDTLAQSSPNVNGFLAGNWSQGGVAAWMSLTTQNQNNPYTRYLASQNELASLVGGATAARQQELQWGQGFLQWCGGDSSASLTGGVANPQVACMSKDGTPVNALTPASMIHDFSQQVVSNSGISQLISVNDLDSALGAIVSALGKQVLGLAGGLFGASKPSASRPSLTVQLSAYSGNNTTASASSNSIADTTIANVDNYTTAWTTISGAANTAASSVTALETYCNAQTGKQFASDTAINAQLTAVQVARTSEINPLLAQAQTAIAAVAPTRTFALKVKAESTAASSVGSANSDAALTLNGDIQTLATMPPSATSVAGAQQNAQSFGGAKANPSGSLTVSGGSLVDQMNLISTNAAALQSQCTPVPPIGFNANPQGGE